MSRRCLFPDPPPPDAEEYCGLKIARIDGPRETVCVKAWTKRAQKPYAYYQFLNASERHRWIEQEKRRHDGHLTEQAKRQADRTDRLARMIERIQVGTLLDYQYGYDQTNVEFFQVVARHGRRGVTLRRIGHETVRGSEQAMAAHWRPCPDNFVGPPFRKVIGAYGISMRCGLATPTTATEEHYCSWYA